MKIKNFSENHNILIRDVEMFSSQPRKLVLPLKLPMFQELEYDCYYSALEAYNKHELIRLFEGYSIPLYDTVVSSVKMSVCFSFQCDKVNTVLHTQITSQNGKPGKELKHIIIMSNTEIRRIISAYINKGGAGLSASYYKNLLINYRVWLENNGQATKELPQIITGAVYRGII